MINKPTDELDEVLAAQMRTSTFFMFLSESTELRKVKEHWNKILVIVLALFGIYSFAHFAYVASVM